MFLTTQQGGFSHVKCLNCQYLATIEKFDVKDNPDVKMTSPIPEGVTIKFPVYVCPICGSYSTEALFPNEVN